MLHPVLGKSHVSHTVSFITNDTPTCSISVLTSWDSSWFHWNAIWCVCVCVVLIIVHGGRPDENMEVMGMCLHCCETAVNGNVIVLVMRLVVGMPAYCHGSDIVGLFVSCHEKYNSNGDMLALCLSTDVFVRNSNYMTVEDSGLDVRLSTGGR
jgi:hypothetical protein